MLAVLVCVNDVGGVRLC